MHLEHRVPPFVTSDGLPLAHGQVDVAGSLPVQVPSQRQRSTRQPRQKSLKSARSAAFDASTHGHWAPRLQRKPLHVHVSLLAFFRAGGRELRTGAGAEATGAELRAPVYLLSQVRGAVVGLVRVGPGLYQEREINPRSEHAVPAPFALGGPIGGSPPRCADACRWADLRTAVFWEDGSPAGATRSRVRVPESQLTRTDDRRWCIKSQVPTEAASGPAVGPPVVLCFAPRGLKPSR